MLSAASRSALAIVTRTLTRVNDIRLWDALRCLWPMRGSIGGLL